MLELKQPRELNKILFPNCPGSWRQRWTAFAPMLPIILMSLVVLWEGMLLTAWIEEADISRRLPPLVVGSILLPLGLFVATDFSARVQMWSSRTLLLGKKRVQTNPGNPACINWKYVVGWQIEPVSSDNTLRKVSVQYRVGWKGTPCREWSMILDAAQVKELRETLRELQRIGRCTASLIDLNEPMATNANRRISVQGMWHFAIGYAFFVHGLPLLLIGIFRGYGSEEGPKLASASFKQFVLNHFHSAAELRAFYIIVGAILILAGAWFYANAVRRAKPLVSVGNLGKLAKSNAEQ